MGLYQVQVFKEQTPCKRFAEALTSAQDEKQGYYFFQGKRRRPKEPLTVFLDLGRPQCCRSMCGCGAAQGLEHVLSNYQPFALDV